MSRLRTEVDLQDVLDKDFAWRLKEIADFKLFVKNAGDQRKAFVRAGVALAYAHWEGFVKRSSEVYLRYVNNQKKEYSDLSDCFIAIGARTALGSFSGSRKTKDHLKLVDFFRRGIGGKAVLSPGATLSTRSNLSSDVFENIALAIGVNIAPYSPWFNFLDESLLKRRNSIAHGDYLDLTSNEFRSLADDVIDLMRQYKNDIANSASRSSYLK